MEAAQQRSVPHLSWVDSLKGLALVLIVVNHVVERIFGYPLAANPGEGWPELGERLRQIEPLPGEGVGVIAENLLRYLGWIGEQGVQVFVVVSGFGLTWGLLSRAAPARIDYGAFLRGRAWRLYPLWITVHLLFALTWVVLGKGVSPLDFAFWCSVVGFRPSPELLYYFAPAWWFIGLIIQLYLVFPLLWWLLRSFGPRRFAILVCGGALLIRGLGILVFDSYLDAWCRGAIFITRLPELGLGMVLAVVWQRGGAERTFAEVLGRHRLTIGATLWLLGVVAAFTLLGNIVYPLLTGAGLFLLFGSSLERTTAGAAPLRGALAWTGRHSYSLWLLHHPLILWLVPAGRWEEPMRYLQGCAAALVLTVVLGLACERLARRGAAALRRSWIAHGPRGTGLRAAAVMAAVGGLLAGGELAVRRWDPQEVMGWGERPSLVVSPIFGWHLRPGGEFHLRWESYDYHLQSNPLGFPGPEYPRARGAGGYRILVTGDAFTSAEGVDTEEAWPRLLERRVKEIQTRRPVEVLNFAITGYGPSQYARIVKSFVPAYRPDLLVVCMFVNDFQDALISDAEIHASIGFGTPTPDSLRGYLGLEHLRAWIQSRLKPWMKQTLLGRSGGRGYFYGNFAAFEQTDADWPERGRSAVADRLAEMRAVCAAAGCRMVVAMVPASIQVCRPDELSYYPDDADFTDLTRFDPDRPQRWAREICGELGVTFLDLRDAFGEDAGRSYQQGNMHWTTEGHRRVAALWVSWFQEEVFGR